MRVNLMMIMFVMPIAVTGCRRSEAVLTTPPPGLCRMATHNTAVWGAIEGWSDPEMVARLPGEPPRPTHHVDIQIKSIIWGGVEPGNLQAISYVEIEEDGTTGADSNVVPLMVDGSLVEGVIFLSYEARHREDGFIEEYYLVGLYRREGDLLIGVHDEYAVEEFIPFAREIHETQGLVCLGAE